MYGWWGMVVDAVVCVVKVVLGGGSSGEEGAPFAGA